jgi:two-component system NarL family sensor kinase
LDAPTPLVAWILVVSGVTTGAVIALMGLVIAWNQRRIAAEAKQWGLHVLAAQDEERHRIARELHDDIVPRVHAARLTTERHATAEAEAQLGEIASRIRTLAHNLHPPSLEYLELGQALADLVTRHRSPTGPTLALDAAEGLALPSESSVALFRVAQEGLANALKHAGAQQIHLRLLGDAASVTLIIEDNGAGMPTSTEQRASFGLRSIRERLGAVGGALTIEASTPTGTRLVATVPRP